MESVKWRPQQAYGSNQVLFAQSQTIFSILKILTCMHRYENSAGHRKHTLSLHQLSQLSKILYGKVLIDTELL